MIIKGRNQRTLDTGSTVGRSSGSDAPVFVMEV